MKKFQTFVEQNDGKYPSDTTEKRLSQQWLS